MTSTAVRVGLRVRPLTQKEELANCTECISFIPNEPQILVGVDKSFTYDYVFDSKTHQRDVYMKAAAPLLEKFVEGFNATILAYGQTGSGKTFSMGTGLESTTNPEHEGIVPRCMVDLFEKLQHQSELNQELSYKVYVSFLELYNEELIDLLNPLKKRGAEVTIREDITGNIYWSGVREELCAGPEELMSYLTKGSLCRTTGSTDMNSVSSRSHAVFSVILKLQKSESEPVLTSKFHFVDLAGSERLKRTHAQGDRAKEGISINAGLLALGNVISALGDESRKNSHVPYRDSKLTRLLQDSLGGNSQTLMLACVSPSDSNFAETLNTLKYANRARNIKNRVTVNQEFAGSSIEVNQLKAQVARLRLELAGMEQGEKESELRQLRGENSRLKERVQESLGQVQRLTLERDTLRLDQDLASPDESRTHPILLRYEQTIEDLRRQLSEKPRRGNSSVTTRTRRKRFPQARKSKVPKESPRLQETGLEQEIQQSIAKAKAEIQKGMEVLDLVKPAEEASWEEELEAFEKAERGLLSFAMERVESDEGNFTATPSPDDLGEWSALSVETEGLSVPMWEPHVSKSTRPSREESKEDGWAEPLLPVPSVPERQDPQLTRMLHQIQSDIRVKEELVTHLEKTESKYAFMRRKFDDKMARLSEQLAQLQEERDKALAAQPVRETVGGLESRHQYEGKIKALTVEIHDLKRNYARTTAAMQSTKSQQESLLKTLRAHVETLKTEKKRTTKRMKQENARVREQIALQEKRIRQLQRQQSEAKHARQRLEREHESQKTTLKRREKEIAASQNQTQALTDLIKKAVREGGTLDEPWLIKVSHVIGGSFAALSRRGLRTRPVRRKKHPVPVAVRVAAKKKVLDRMVGQYVQGKQAIVEMEQLLLRRDRLVCEKQSLLEERGQIVWAERETADLTGQPVDSFAIGLADERVDLMEAEIAYLTARIQALQWEAASELSAEETGERRKVVRFADDIVAEPWAWEDVGSEEEFCVPENAGPELVHHATLKLLKSLEVDECRWVIESLVEDVFNSRLGECSRQMTMQNLEKSLQDLRRTLIVMKRAAIATTVEHERRIRTLEGSGQGSDRKDSRIEDYISNSGNTIFDKIYEDGLRGLLCSPEPAQAKEEVWKTSVGRQATPSPDRFYQMIQKRVSWQERTGGSPVPMTMMNPAEFNRYANERESSTSSIRSNHIRRGSLQSDPSYGSHLSVQPPVQAPLLSRPPGSVRDLSPGLVELEAELMSLQRNPQPTPTFSPVTHSVFARLAHTPTRASKARATRYSSSSLDELRVRSESERTSSALSGLIPRKSSLEHF